jgi:hypothetical protein
MFFQAFIEDDITVTPSANVHAMNGLNEGTPNLSGRSEVFTNPFGACNFIVTWDGEDVRELLDAIKCARTSSDRFIQDKLIEYILNIPIRNPRPSDVPAFAGKPVWAVDHHGRALIGMPGSEEVVDAETLKIRSRTNGHAKKDALPNA